LRNEIEAVQQGVGLGYPQIETLNEHGPGVFRAAQLAGFLWSALEFPFVAATTYQARFDVGVAGHREEVGMIQQAAEAGHGLAHQEGFFLPVFVQELARREAAKQVRIHWRIIPNLSGLGAHPSHQG